MTTFSCLFRGVEKVFNGGIVVWEAQKIVFPHFILLQKEDETLPEAHVERSEKSAIEKRVRGGPFLRKEDGERKKMPFLLKKRRVFI